MRKEAGRPALVLASASPRRLALLARIGIEPALVLAADIDEAGHLGERPAALAARLAVEKLHVIAARAEVQNLFPAPLILAADTVVSVGRRVLPKAESAEEARGCLSLLSGRRHAVTTGVAIARGAVFRSRIVETRLRFKRLSEVEIERYVACGEWEGKAGGYGIQGRAEAFIPWISGSHSNVVGLPLAETANLIESLCPGYFS